MTGEMLSMLLPDVDLTVVLHAENVMHDVKTIKHELQEAERKHADFLASIKARLVEVQGRCRHAVYKQCTEVPSKAFDECLVCGHRMFLAGQRDG